MTNKLLTILVVGLLITSCDTASDGNQAYRDCRAQGMNDFECGLASAGAGIDSMFGTMGEGFIGLGRLCTWEGTC